MSGFAARRRFRWLTFRLWRQRLVFWGGAVAVGCISVAVTEAANFCQTLFKDVTTRFWLLPILITPLGFALCASLARRYFPGAEGSGIPQAIAARKLTQRADRHRLLAPRLIIGKIGLTLLAFALRRIGWPRGSDGTGRCEYHAAGRPFRRLEE